MTASARKSRILIAADNVPDADLLKAELSGLDYQVEIVVDQRHVLEKIGQFHPDLIVLGLTMPSLVGFDVCKKLKGGPETGKIMILLVGSLSESADVERAVDSGVDDFLSKPVNKVELLTRVRNLLKLQALSSD